MSESETSAPVREGEVIADKYRIDRVLGAGGMGIVVAATHVHLDQQVALKFLLPRATEHPDVVARFAREARAAVKIRSEHVARVLDVGTLPSGAPFMVMEYLEGEDLEQTLRRRGPLPIDEAVGYVLQGSEAIAEAHALGFVHRDLKPANLFLAETGRGPPIVKVLDFGISKLPGSTRGAGLTKSSVIMGSPLYMSPEQLIAARSVDSRADLWALGVVLYELLTQRSPFPRETMPQLIAAIVQDTPDGLRVLRPDAPPGLEATIRRCLEKDPAHRFANIAELAIAIAPFGPPRGDQSVERISHVLGVASASKLPPPPVTPTLASAPSEPHGTHSPLSRSASLHPAKSLSRAMIAGLAALALMAVVLASLLVRRRSEPPAWPAVAAPATPPEMLPTGPARAEVQATEGRPSPPSILVPSDLASPVPVAPPVSAAPPSRAEGPIGVATRTRPRPSSPRASASGAPPFPAPPGAASSVPAPPAKNPLNITPL